VFQGFEVIAAYLAGDITQTTCIAGMNDFGDCICIIAQVVKQALPQLKPPAGRIGIEIVVANTGTIVAKPMTLYLVKRSPFAVRTIAATLHHRSEIL
jgi:hypothetical protein